ATNRDWKNKNGQMVSETNFHRLVAFGKLGEIVGKYLKKGRPVLVSGRLNNRSYVAKDGGKRYVTEVVLDDFNFLSSGKKKAADDNAALDAENVEYEEVKEAVAA
ncbi:single-stranded DNA-binding protein, partial [Candidatus Peregrinibacteria bacterium]|nr:single-stranded DNA-binding protein [Candidatus Peregrinibacteria bacterium]